MNPSLPVAVKPSVAPAQAVAAVPAVAVPAVAVRPSVAPIEAVSPAATRATALIHATVADWSAAAAPEKLPDPVPAAAPADRSRPRLSRALKAAGGLSLAAAAAAPILPVLLPAAPLLTWGGLAALAAAPFWRSPSAVPDAPRGPPATEEKGMFSSFKALWAAAKSTADAQSRLGARVGGGSAAAYRDWALGGLRTGATWLGVSLGLMLGGFLAGKAYMAATGLALVKKAQDLSAVAHTPLLEHLNSITAPALALQAVSLAAFFGVRKAAEKLGAGRAAPWIAGAAALTLSGAAILQVTTAPVLVGAMLAIEAGALMTAQRSNSFLAPMALRGILSLFSVEAARVSSWLTAGTMGTLVGLPAALTGGAVAAMLLAAFLWSARGRGLLGAWRLQSDRLKALGESMRADTGDRPKSPWPVVRMGLLWALVTYAAGDLTYWAFQLVSPGAEPAPASLVKSLTGPLDTVLYTFVIVGLLEEFVFRRGVFKPLLARLEKFKLSPRAALGWALVLSSLFFSWAHYVDWGAIMIKLGFMDPASSGLAGTYAWSWAGFMARAVCGVVLAYQYWRSGLLMVPIVAHFAANTMEGLGLRWGFEAFLAMAAALLAVQFLGKSSRNSGSTQRS